MKKNLIVISCIVVALCLFFCFVDIKSVDEYYLENAENIEPNSKIVYIKINCKNAVDNKEKLDKKLKNQPFLDNNGVILQQKKFVLREKDTVLAATIRACKSAKIQCENAGDYIESFSYLYEFSCGSLSGWMYKVNGKFPKKSSADFILKNGDKIEWIYTCDLGRDVGNIYGGNNEK